MPPKSIVFQIFRGRPKTNALPIFGPIWGWRPENPFLAGGQGRHLFQAFFFSLVRRNKRCQLRKGGAFIDDSLRVLFATLIFSKNSSILDAKSPLKLVNLG